MKRIVKSIITKGNVANGILIHFWGMALKPFSMPKTTRVTTKKLGTSITDNPNPSPLPKPNINEFTITVARINQGILNQNLHIASAKPIINKTGNVKTKAVL